MEEDKTPMILKFRIPLTEKYIVAPFKGTQGAESIKDVLNGEKVVIDYLIKDFGFRDLLFKEIFGTVKDVCYYTTLTEPFTKKNSKPGDIDLLLFKRDK